MRRGWSGSERRPHPGSTEGRLPSGFARPLEGLGWPRGGSASPEAVPSERLAAGWCPKVSEDTDGGDGSGSSGQDGCGVEVSRGTTPNAGQDAKKPDRSHIAGDPEEWCSQRAGQGGSCFKR